MVFDYLDLGADRVECLWVRIKGKVNYANILQDFCSRPPSQDEETKHLIKELGKASQLLAHVLMGDCNLARCRPEIKYSREEAEQEVSGGCGRTSDTAGEESCPSGPPV